MGFLRIHPPARKSRRFTEPCQRKASLLLSSLRFDPCGTRHNWDREEREWQMLCPVTRARAAAMAPTILKEWMARFRIENNGDNLNQGTQSHRFCRETGDHKTPLKGHHHLKSRQHDQYVSSAPGRNASDPARGRKGRGTRCAPHP